ncbi:MAG: hypothetical protein L3K03_07230 [Thermoplasmata archaeon]|nr:hypothetical protein [Thermoplasmata archaeon]
MKVKTVAARAELERWLPPTDPRLRSLAALPDEMEAEQFDASFELILRLLRQRPADAGPR